MRKNITKVICGNCGAEVIIPENGTAFTGMTIGRNSNLGTIILPTKKDLQGLTKEQRMDLSALITGGNIMDKIANMNVEDVKAIMSTIASSMSAKITESAEATSMIKKEILSSGTIMEHHLYKQHVLAQMFKMMTRKHTWWESADDKYDPELYHKNLVRCGYDYTWRVLEDKLHEQAAMKKHGDEKCFAEDNRWYNKELVVTMLEDYIKQLEELISHAKVAKYRHHKYIALKVDAELIGGTAGFNLKKGFPLMLVDELYTSINVLINRVQREGDDSVALYEIVKKWNGMRPALHIKDSMMQEEYRLGDAPFWLRGGKQCNAWQNAYKGYGAFFSMQNLILFYGMRFKRIQSSDSMLNEQQSIARLERLANLYKADGYKLLGVFKEFLVANNVDIKSIQNSWDKH